MGKFGSLLALGSLALALATPASAGTLDRANTTLQIRLAGLPALTFTAEGTPGTATLSPGPVVSDTATLWSTQGFTLGTALFTGVPIISNLAISVMNAPGTFTPSFTALNYVGAYALYTRGPALGGGESLLGQVSILAGNGALMIPVGLSIVGRDGNILQSCTPYIPTAGPNCLRTTATAFDYPIVATGGPFGTGPAPISYISTDRISITNGPRAGVTGAPITLQATAGEMVMLLTEAAILTVTTSGGVVQGGDSTVIQLVSPLRVFTSGLAADLPGYAVKTFTFVPEPTRILLQLGAVAGLLLLGWKRARRG